MLRNYNNISLLLDYHHREQALTIGIPIPQQPANQTHHHHQDHQQVAPPVTGMVAIPIQDSVKNEDSEAGLIRGIKGTFCYFCTGCPNTLFEIFIFCPKIQL